MLKLDYSPVPLVLGLVLGPLLERGVRRTLIVSNGDPAIFVQQPIALTFFLLTGAAIAAPVLKRVAIARAFRSGRAFLPSSRTPPG
jgi:putative tricarboxylic transport membrane protein